MKIRELSQEEDITCDERDHKAKYEVALYREAELYLCANHLRSLKVLLSKVVTHSRNRTHNES